MSLPCADRYRYCLGFGSNVGQRHRNLDLALAGLSAWGTVITASTREETPPLRHAHWDTSDHGWFINFVADYATNLAPMALYVRIRQLEDLLGHRRDRIWAPRALDIDILEWRDNTHPWFAACRPLALWLEQPYHLKIPHPALEQRSFWIRGRVLIGALIPSP